MPIGEHIVLYSDIEVLSMRRQRKNHRKALITWIVLLAVLLTGLVAYAAYDILTVHYKNAVTVEAGANLPEADAFFSDFERAEAQNAQLLIEPGVDTATPGTYNVYLQVEGV